MTQVNVRYMVHDVDAAVAFYTTHLGFVSFQINHRLSLMSSEETCAFFSAGQQLSRTAMQTVENPARRMKPDPLNCDRYRGGSGSLHAKGVRFLNDIVRGPGGAQILVEDPSGNVVELFQPAS